MGRQVCTLPVGGGEKGQDGVKGEECGVWKGAMCCVETNYIEEYLYLQDHSTKVLFYDQFMSQRVNWRVAKPQDIGS